MKSVTGKTSADILILSLALINVAVHLLVIKNLEYHRDELLYFSLGQHPAAGYATVPPLIGWIACIMENIFGYSVFAVRVFPALLSGVMIFLAAGMAKELGGSGYASFLAASCVHFHFSCLFL
jgi:4-amino-4-deoxy-L-arabinose transferase-like glycosyltransferase